VWVSVPEGANTSNSATYVFDPSLGRKGRGAWVKYSFGCHAFAEWRRTTAVTKQLGAAVGTKKILDLNTSNSQDDFGSGDTNVTSYFRTSWFDGGSANVIKRFRRPEFVLDADVSTQVRVDVYRDFDPSFAVKTFYINGTGPSGGTWDSGSWDSMLWGAESDGRQDIDRGGPLGRARAVQLKFTQDLNYSTSVTWGVSSVGMKYIPKRLR
jgi:hypothetical protein